MSLIAALSVLSLVIVEHTKTIRPSTLLSIYLVTAILAGAVQLRTIIIRPWATAISPGIANLMITSLVCKILLFVLESWPKERTIYLYDRVGEEHSPEEKTGFFGRAVFWWLIPLFWSGYKSVLTPEDLFPLESKLNSHSLRHQMIDCWERREFSGYNLWRLKLTQPDKLKKSYPLMRATASLLLWPFLDSIFPRLARIAFSYSQTFVLGAAIRYLEMPRHEKDINHAYGLIGATLITYFGCSVSAHEIILINANKYSRSHQSYSVTK